MLLKPHYTGHFKNAARYGTLGVLLGLTILMCMVILALVWPYNDVRFGSPTSVVQNPVVKQGGVVFVENPWFCNDNQNTVVERWVDVLDKDDKPIGSYEMFSVQFFRAGTGLNCQKPAVSAFTLPNYVIGVNGAAGRFRLRQVISYKPNPVKTVYVDLLSTPFVVLPVK
jgi:hypothetical protein